MAYQYGYPPQQPYPQQPYPQQPYPQQNADNPLGAVIAAVFGLLATGALVALNVDFFGEFPDGLGFGDLPGELKTLVIIRFAAAVVLLIGAILVFARKLAGAFLLLGGGLFGIACVLLYPTLASVPPFVTIPFDLYFEELFKFADPMPIFSFATLLTSLVTLLMAVLPPTLRYLKGSAAANPYAGYSQPQW